MFVAGLAGATWLLLGWLAPWRYRLRQEARERGSRATSSLPGASTRSRRSCCAPTSRTSSRPTSARSSRTASSAASRSSRATRSARPQAYGLLLDQFIAFARERDWRIAILGASERCLELYRAHGLHALYHGDEAVVETASFSLEGRPIRKVRQSVHRLARAGYRAEVLRPRAIDQRLRDELEAIAREWRGTEPERGFVMALDALFGLDDEDALFVVGRTPAGAPAGFLHFAVSPAGGALSLSSMPRLRSTPNGFNEWLVCAAVDWARAHGIARVSLNFAPFAALLAPEAELTRLQRLERGALLRLKGHFQLDNLLPSTASSSRRGSAGSSCTSAGVDLPRVGIAALAAEAYLPFTGRNGR